MSLILLWLLMTMDMTDYSTHGTQYINDDEYVVSLYPFTEGSGLEDDKIMR
jgi:hypothetical protein